MKIAITICASERYTYAMAAQARRVQSAVRYAEITDSQQTCFIILAGDKSKSLEGVAELYRKLLPNWTTILLAFDGINDKVQNYKAQAQMNIAQLRTAVCAKARELDVDYCYSLDSDVLPAFNSIRCCLDALTFDKGYYSIAMSPYPSQGLGGLLGGRGTPQNPILPNWTDDERACDPKLLEEKKSIIDFAKTPRKPEEYTPAMKAKLERMGKRVQEINEVIKKSPPKADVHSLNGAGKWKRRGWFDYAYPAIGIGAMVPTDWTGFGSTMMNRAALSLCDWSAYGSGNADQWGTEDLYINFRRWHQRSLKAAVIPHALSAHVCRDPGNPKKFIVVEAYHETDGECVGHVRYRRAPFYENTPGEQFDPNNDGNPTLPKSLGKQFSRKRTERFKFHE